MVEKELDLGDHEVTWALSGYDTLKAEIRVTDTGVTCLSVTVGACNSTTPPGVTVSAFTVTGHLKSEVAPPTTCPQSFRIIEKDTNNPISGAKVTADGKTCITDALGKCTIELTKGKSISWIATKSGYAPVGYTFPFTACVAEKKMVLVPVALPKECKDYTTRAECEAVGCYWYMGRCSGVPEQPPEVAKFGLSEVVENHLPEWISGYACASCRGLDVYKCPTGYMLTKCETQARLGGHGCCTYCTVSFVKCERGITPPTTLISWIDETGVTNLTKDHGAYVFYVAAGAGAAADDKHARLSPKPSKMDPALASKDIAVGIFYYSQGAMVAGNDKTGCNYGG